MTTPVIAIHGGAGTITRASLSAEDEARYHQALSDIVAAAQAVLNAGGSALEAVTEAVRLLEDCPLFNAGHGAVYTSEGKHELDACVMNGADLASGAVACVTKLRNPVLAARTVGGLEEADDGRFLDGELLEGPRPALPGRLRGALAGAGLGRHTGAGSPGNAERQRRRVTAAGRRGVTGLGERLVARVRCQG